MREFKKAFTLAEGRLACTTTQAHAKAQRCQYVITSECEAIQPIEKDVNRHKSTGTNSCNHLITQSPVLDLLHAHGDSPKERCSSRLVPFAIRTRYAPSVRKSASHLITSKAAAFTLAEVLITLAVIGIVAALTLPGLIKNHNEKARSTAKDLWEKKLTETVRRMNTDGVMTGHDTTEDFMNTFKNYMKVIKTCDNNDINKCYSPKIVQTGSDSEPIEVETSDLKTAENLGNSEWGTNTMSFVIADGTTVIMAYNPNCAYADPIEDTGSQVSCLGFMVDVNGKKGPNRVGDDIALKGQISLSNCDNPIGDMCWSTDFVNTAIDTCDGTSEYDKNFTSSVSSYCSTNYWAGAKKACSDMGMSLPTRAQLAQLASEIYLKSDGSAVTINEKEDYSLGDLQIKDEYKDPPPLTLDSNYWSSEERGNGAYFRGFFNSNTTGSDYWRGSKYTGDRVICISN